MRRLGGGGLIGLLGTSPFSLIRRWYDSYDHGACGRKRHHSERLSRSKLRVPLEQFPIAELEGKTPGADAVVQNRRSWQRTRAPGSPWSCPGGSLASTNRRERVGMHFAAILSSTSQVDIDDLLCFHKSGIDAGFLPAASFLAHCVSRSRLR